MLRRFLTEQEAEVLAAERSQLIALRDPLRVLEATDEDLALLDRALLQLDDLFLLMVVGEFNSGKSAFINALFGRRYLDEGVTPTTSGIHIMRYGETETLVQTGADVLIATYPVEWLKEVSLVDTPGTNAVIQRHQAITEEFVPRADMILFVTSADRPFTESERLFLQRIRTWGKKVVVVVNKIDILETPGDVEAILAFVEQNCRELLGRKPTIFAVSARQARQAKETIDADERTRLWKDSNFQPLERYLIETLNERERIRLKLANPLGIAHRLIERYLQVAEERKGLLRDDISTVHTIEAQLTMHETDLRRDFRFHASHIDNVLYAMTERGDRFFDETVRLGRIFDLINAEKVRGMFEREVIADTSAQVDSQTRDLIDWMVDQDFRLWQSVTDYVGKRMARHQDAIIGASGTSPGGSFETNRQALLASVGQAARTIVASYDQNAEARKLADSVQLAVAQTAIVEVGAVGLGALLVKLLATAALDITGILAAGGIAALGLYVIPFKRNRAKASLRSKTGELRSQLHTALSSQFEQELARSMARIREAIRPYSRFVELQQGLVDDAGAKLHSIRTRVNELESLVGEKH